MSSFSYELHSLSSYNQKSSLSPSTPSANTENYELDSLSTNTHKLLPKHGPSMSLLPQKSPSSVMTLVKRLLTVAKLMALPLLTIAYLSFCFIVNKRLVPLKNKSFYAFKPDHIATIKAGVTSLSSLIICVALYPMKDIVSALQSEEFFRVLRTRRIRGVPLAKLDQISNPKYGSLSDVMSRYSSIHMVYAFLATLIGLAISLITPAALNVATVLVESDIVALVVGAIPPQGVYNTSDPAPEMAGYTAIKNSALAASVLWSEMELGANYSFSAVTSDSEFEAYIVPIPIDLPTSANAHWMSDVIGVNPSCAWASTNISTTQLQNQSDSAFSSAGVYLENLDLDVEVTSLDYGVSTFNINVMDPFVYVSNHSTNGPATDGSTVFAVSQCATGCEELTLFDPLVLNLTNIPTFILDVNATDYSKAQTWHFAFLACKPNAVIQTREIVSNGTGLLEVLPVRDGKQYVSQGNLHSVQTSLMLTYALSGITNYAGPSNASARSAGSYTTVQADFLFGKEQVDNLPALSGSQSQTVVLTILPTETLGRSFAGMLQSASKSYLKGFLGTAYVPAKVFSSQVVFVSSMPFIIASAVMFGILFILMMTMHVRRDERPFTLVSVCAALHGSNLPGYFAWVGKSRGLIVDGDQRRRVVLQKGDDGMNVLQIVDEQDGKA